MPCPIAQNGADGFVHRCHGLGNGLRRKRRDIALFLEHFKVFFHKRRGDGAHIAPRAGIAVNAGVALERIHNGVLVSVGGVALVGHDEGRAALHPFGAHGKGPRHAASVSDAAGRHNGNGAHAAGHRDHGKRADLPDVAAGLGARADNGVGAEILHLFGDLGRGHNRHDLNAGRLPRGDEILGRAGARRDHRHFLFDE